MVNLHEVQQRYTPYCFDTTHKMIGVIHIQSTRPGNSRFHLSCKILEIGRTTCFKTSCIMITIGCDCGLAKWINRLVSSFNKFCLHRSKEIKLNILLLIIWSIIERLLECINICVLCSVVTTAFIYLLLWVKVIHVQGPIARGGGGGIQKFLFYYIRTNIFQGGIPGIPPRSPLCTRMVKV